MTKLTWCKTHLGPIEMWVDARTWRDYQPQGFVLVDFEAPPEWLRGVYSGKALIRKPGSEEDYTWSPELAALHKAVWRLEDEARRGLKFGTIWRRLREAGSKLIDAGYHEKLMFVEKGSTDTSLEEVRDRIVETIRKISLSYKGETKRRILMWASSLENWRCRGIPE